jgi:hypothetical protein
MKSANLSNVRKIRFAANASAAVSWPTIEFCGGQRHRGAGQADLAILLLICTQK